MFAHIARALGILLDAHIPDSSSQVPYMPNWSNERVSGDRETFFLLTALIRVLRAM